MLILTRRVGETVRIGDEVEVTVLGMKGGQVRLGITAPSSIPVHREEVYARIRTEQTAAAETAETLTTPVADRPEKVTVLAPGAGAARTRRDRPGG